ncbi:MAG: tetratricopeptide repeat protein [Patescibacteria group bacterium]
MKDGQSKKIKIGQEFLSENEAMSRALEYHKAGDFQSAEIIYRKIYVQNPRCAGAPHLSGLIQYHFGDFAAAAKSLRRAIALDDSLPHYHYNLGLIYLDEGKKAEAGECFQKALALDGNYQSARIMLLETKTL